MFVQVFLRFFGVGVFGDGFIHECAGGVGGAVFAVCTRGQDGDVVEVVRS